LVGASLSATLFVLGLYIPHSAHSVTVSATATPPSTLSRKSAVLHNYGQLPLNFESNQGQTDRRVRFLARGSDYNAAADPRPHYLDNRLYVRMGNSTEELTGRDLEDWLRQRP
jgi:hypothetical protein